MLNKLRKIGSILLIAVLLTPSIAKLEHHHDGFVCQAKHEKHYHTHHQKCWVCAFEFSLFSLTAKTVVAPPISYPAAVNDGERLFKFNSTSSYSFLLRAPPIVCA
jgi:hypothetical protein